jgi:hypothetical protein
MGRWTKALADATPRLCPTMGLQLLLEDSLRRHRSTRATRPTDVRRVLPASMSSPASALAEARRVSVGSVR